MSKSTMDGQSPSVTTAAPWPGSLLRTLVPVPVPVRVRVRVRVRGPALAPVYRGGQPLDDDLFGRAGRAPADDARSPSSTTPAPG